jgi:hypothetical protein
VPAISDLIPPLVPKLFSRMHRGAVSAEPELFDGHGELFKRIVATARVYGEYGVGASTDWVYANTEANIIAVETSPVWAEAVLRGKDGGRISIGTPDLGEVEEWGRPATYGLRENFALYSQFIWRVARKPDTVLIDGRFRVACFVASLLNANAGTRILFDDYSDRRHYHVIEEILEPIELCGRQALFHVPEAFDRQGAAQIAVDFRMVMD